MALGLSNPTVTVNDEVILIKADSFEYTLGFGDMNLRPESAGGGSQEIVATEDVSTKISMCKFTVLTKSTTKNQVTGWLVASRRGPGNVVKASEGDFNVTFRQARIITDTNFSLGSEGETEIEFKANPTG